MSLVEEWQSEHTTVRFIWKIEDVIKLIVEALDASQHVRETIPGHDGAPVADASERREILHKLTFFLDALRRVQVATAGISRIVSMFEDQGYKVESAHELRQKQPIIPDIISDVESFQENLEWQELEETAIPSITIRAVADHLASTGQASA